MGALQMTDISQEMFGKYQCCTKHEGEWYADEDFEFGNGIGLPKDGALPKPLGYELRDGVWRGVGHGPVYKRHERGFVA